ncbi:death-associated protein kinase 3 [Halyomorpha halys]|uniref:death-associated protein kinase 3 n=1 Tax=Halyomorpha halys TaxID=286706 RepID=UPI0006D4CCB5|nr:death-associated protein kinase 3-like [Halyomorpha halys]
MIVYPPSPRPKGRLVHWKQTNVEEGLVRVDQAMLTKLIKKEPIEKYYRLDPEPFATGMFASVRRCRSLESGELLAAKFSSRMRYGEDATREIHHEIALLSLCSPSPRIIRLHDVFQTPQQFIIVMEYAPGGDMQTIIDDNLVPYEKDVVKFVQDVVEALAYLHHRKIAHLDIKPQNLVMMGEFPDCDVKVCDFEISRVILDGTEVHEILGTPEYVAPEILHYEPITLAADMWSLGVTTYVLLTGFSPFGGETDQETFLNISRAQVDFPDELFEDVSDEAKDFVSRLLVRNPSERMTAKECLKHPWLAKNRRTTRPGKRNTTKSDRRVGCSSCSPSNQNLRNYLSKSREALFEKVMSRNAEKSLRKTTLLQQYHRTKRMCESQMSLVSKSRERALMKESIMSRSREKLYGLKSLSKSQEVLNLYRSVLNLQESQEDKSKAFSSILKLRGDESLNSSMMSISDAENNHKDDEEPVLDIIRRLSNASVAGDREENKENIRNIDQDSKENFFKPPFQEAKNNSIKNSLPEENETEPCDVKNNNVVERLVFTQAPEEDQPPSPESTDSMSFTEGATTSEEDLRRLGGETTEEDEPRFTVAQLVSAYNKHQEIVTKTSIEVAMSKQEVDAKIGSKFPTGPNALRLFIPDIKIRRQKPKKRMPRKNTGITLPEIQIEEVTANEEEGMDLKSENKEEEVLCLGVEAPPPKYLRSESFSSETSKSSQEEEVKKPPKKPYYMTSTELKQQPLSNVAKTVELFNNGRVAQQPTLSSPVSNRPDRKSFSLPQPPVLQNDKIRRKSSPPTMKPFM